MNRKRIGPGSNPEPLSPAVLSLASIQRLTASGRPCRDCRLPLTPPHGWRPTSVDDLYLDGGLAFSWMMAQLSSSNHPEGLSDPICAFQQQQSDRLRVARDSTLASFGPFQRFLLPKRAGAHTTAFEPLSWRVPGPSPSPFPSAQVPSLLRGLVYMLVGSLVAVGQMLLVWHLSFFSF